MNINSKINVRRGVNFADKDAAALTLEWKSNGSIESGDLAAMAPVSGEAVMRTVVFGSSDITDAMVTNVGGTTSTLTTKVAAFRNFLYVCYQGSEETENEFFPVVDSFVKLSDLYVDLELKDIDSTQWGESAVGDCLDVDDNGFLGTYSITSNNSDTDANSYDGATSTAPITGTMVVAKTQDTDGDYIVSVIC